MFERLNTGYVRDLHVDTLRGLACVLLVFFHLVGTRASSGLMIDYPHWLRVLNDSLTVVRMPLFAFIAGFVYAIRPPAAESWGKFLSGKVRRLIVPGAVAIAVYLAVSDLAGTGLALPLAESWKAFAFPYAHFWFLKSIFLLLVVFSAFDILARRRFAVPALIATWVIALSGVQIDSDVLGLQGAMHLAPCFVLGVIVERHAPTVPQKPRLAILVLCLFIGAFAATKLQEFADTGSISRSRNTVSALFWGQAACLTGYFALPKIGLLARLAPYTFTIYLYHAIAVTGFRQLLFALGVEDLAVHVCLTLAVGIAVPILLHKLCAKEDVSRRLVLGLRPRPRTPALVLAGS